MIERIRRPVVVELDLSRLEIDAKFGTLLPSIIAEMILVQRLEAAKDRFVDADKKLGGRRFPILAFQNVYVLLLREIFVCGKTGKNLFCDFLMELDTQLKEQKLYLYLIEGGVVDGDDGTEAETGKTSKKIENTFNINCTRAKKKLAELGVARIVARLMPVEIHLCPLPQEIDPKAPRKFTDDTLSMPVYMPNESRGEAPGCDSNFSQHPGFNFILEVPIDHRVEDLRKLRGDVLTNPRGKPKQLIANSEGIFGYKKVSVPKFYEYMGWASEHFSK